MPSPSEHPQPLPRAPRGHRGDGRLSHRDDASFASLGLDSAMAVHFVLEIEEWLGIELYPSVTEDYPTLQNLQRLCSEPQGVNNRAPATFLPMS